MTLATHYTFSLVFVSVLISVGASHAALSLSDRVRAVDGHLHLVSPPGGPTVVTVDLPLSS